ncbi:MAG TPA: glutathione peroxidase [Planctomycetota bacterium]|nr:glutathione peroxidase [Planctomycetota bacterium]
MTPTTRLVITVATVVVLALAAMAIAGCFARRPPRTGAVDVHAFTLTANEGSAYPLARHRGQALVIVNTASKCGYTGQYAGLQALSERYRERGLIVIGVPANDFLWQEPGDDAAVRRFCSATFGVSFPLMGKSRVTGRGMLPLYAWLTGESARPGRIRWNFTKFVIGRDGRVVERFGPATEPDDATMVAAIERALADPSP